MMYDVQFNQNHYVWMCKTSGYHVASKGYLHPIYDDSGRHGKDDSDVKVSEHMQSYHIDEVNKPTNNISLNHQKDNYIRY